MDVDTSKKDLLISQLKAHIFEMEQNERNFNNLNNKFKSLQNDFILLSEEKMRLEYEYKGKTESNCKQLKDLKRELDNTNTLLNEKLIQNKKLYQDYTNLQMMLENKSNEISHLRNGLNDIVQKNGQLSEEKKELEKLVNELKEIKLRNKNEIERFTQENSKLSMMCKDEELIIKSLEIERNKFFEMNEELKIENSSLHSKIKQRDDNLNYYQKQLDESNKTILKLNGNIKDLENQSQKLHHELENLNNINQKEIRLRIEQERSYGELELIIKDKDREMKMALKEFESLSVEKDKLYEDNIKMFNEIDRLKNHIYILSDQNHKVINF